MAKIPANSIGFFITQSAEEAKRAWFFCKSCHSDVKDENLIKKCKCKHFSNRSQTNVTSQGHTNIPPNPFMNIKNSVMDKDENLIKKCKCKHFSNRSQTNVTS